jgi:phosphate transport system protein
VRTRVRIRLGRKIDKLKTEILALGAKVEESLQLAVKALECRDPELAAQVIDGDSEIDTKEVDLEEECLEILALHQPVAADLRYIVAVLKINNDLERIGDLAVNIAETAIHMGTRPASANPFDYSAMAEKTQDMLKKALDALVNMETTLAYQVCAEDDEVDYMKHMIHRKFQDKVREDLGNLESLVHLFLVSRHLERIADHATNIAEEVIYMITGEIHRHRGEMMREKNNKP